MLEFKDQDGKVLYILKDSDTEPTQVAKKKKLEEEENDELCPTGERQSTTTKS